jgi:hypothetical protein
MHQEVSLRPHLIRAGIQAQNTCASILFTVASGFDVTTLDRPRGRSHVETRRLGQRNELMIALIVKGSHSACTSIPIY